MYQTALPENHSPGKTVCWESLSSQQDALGIPDKTTAFDINSSIPACLLIFNQVYCSDVWFLFFKEAKKNSKQLHTVLCSKLLKWNCILDSHQFAPTTTCLTLATLKGKSTAYFSFFDTEGAWIQDWQVNISFIMGNLRGNQVTRFAFGKSPPLETGVWI